MGEREYLRVDYDGGKPRSAFWATYPATKAILIGLVGIHVLMAIVLAVSVSAYVAVCEILMLYPEYVLKKFFLWQLVTYALLHAQDTIWHVAFNALMIFFFGRIVEQRIGTKRFLYFCLAAIVCSSLAFLLESVIRGQTFPMLGASGFAMGLTVLAACWYPRMTVLVLFVIPAPLWVLAAILVIVDFITMLNMPGDIAHAAHLGGALYGFLYFRYGGRFERIFRSIDAMADKQRAKKEQRNRAREAELRREVDRILDKVNREGMAALTREERRFLKEASEKLR